MFWVLVTFDKFAYCRWMAKVRSQRGGGEKGKENWLTEGGKRLAIKKKKGTKKNFSSWKKKALSSDEWTAKVSRAQFAEHAQSGNASKNSPLFLNLQTHIRNLVKTSFFMMFWYLCFWQLSCSRKHKGSNGNLCYLCACFRVCIPSVLPSFLHVFRDHLAFVCGTEVQDALALKPWNETCFTKYIHCLS